MAHRVLQDLNDRVGTTVGLTLNQVLVLSEIERGQGRATVSGLATTLGRAVHTLTSAVNGLERKGLVSRRTLRGEDRRIIRISATSAGNDRLATFRQGASSVKTAMGSQPFDQTAPVEIDNAVQAMLRLLG
ncbi:MAG: MarR family transcriptional regulator [Dehalococcoidia bacterium]